MVGQQSEELCDTRVAWSCSCRCTLFLKSLLMTTQAKPSQAKQVYKFTTAPANWGLISRPHLPKPPCFVRPLEARFYLTTATTKHGRSSRPRVPESVSVCHPTTGLCYGSPCAIQRGAVECSLCSGTTPPLLPANAQELQTV